MPCLLNRQKRMRFCVPADYSRPDRRGDYSRSLNVSVVGAQPSISIRGPDFVRPVRSTGAAARTRLSSSLTDLPAATQLPSGTASGASSEGAEAMAWVASGGAPAAAARALVRRDTHSAPARVSDVGVTGDMSISLRFPDNPAILQSVLEGSPAIQASFAEMTTPSVTSPYDPHAAALAAQTAFAAISPGTPRMGQSCPACMLPQLSGESQQEPPGVMPVSGSPAAGANGNEPLELPHLSVSPVHREAHGGPSVLSSEGSQGMTSQTTPLGTWLEGRSSGQDWGGAASSDANFICSVPSADISASRTEELLLSNHAASGTAGRPALEAIPSATSQAPQPVPSEQRWAQRDATAGAPSEGGASQVVQSATATLSAAAEGGDTVESPFFRDSAQQESFKTPSTSDTSGTPVLRPVAVSEMSTVMPPPLDGPVALPDDMHADGSPLQVCTHRLDRPVDRPSDKAQPSSSVPSTAAPAEVEDSRSPPSEIVPAGRARSGAAGTQTATHFEPQSTYARWLSQERTSRQYELAVEVQSGSAQSCFRFTKIIHVKDKYIIENRTGEVLEVSHQLLCALSHPRCEHGPLRPA
jgi:hypothetical protein